MKIKLAADNNNDIAAGVITVNNFFAHLIKEIDIKRYGDDIPILPLTSTVGFYRYSDEMLKHMPKKALKTIENDLLYSKKKLDFTVTMTKDLHTILQQMQQCQIEPMKTLQIE